MPQKAGEDTNCLIECGRACAERHAGQPARDVARDAARVPGVEQIGQNALVLDDPADPVLPVNENDQRANEVIDDMVELVEAVPPEPAETQREAPPAAAQQPQQEAMVIRNACCVCRERTATHAYVPCGHQCSCAICVAHWPRNCPRCGAESEGAYRIYHP